MAGKSGYTIYWNKDDAEDFWATNDYAALMHAMALAADKESQIFELYRTGFDRWQIRQVACVTDKVC